MQRLVRILNVGKIKYGDSLKLQQQLAQQHFTGECTVPNTLLIVEHDPVYTIGIRTKNYTIEDEERLIKLGAEFYRTNRGGLITFHGPGQLVAYPIINLKHFKPSVRWYVENIEKTIIDLCAQLNISAETSPHTGVWIGDNKICAIGIHCKRFVTTHGLALNCNVDLKWYEHIVPCGIENKGVTSLSKELCTNFTINDALPLFFKSFQKTFDCELISDNSFVLCNNKIIK